MAVLRVPGRGNPNAKWDSLIKVGLDARQHQDKEAFLNMAFYLGNQEVNWVTLKDGTGALKDAAFEGSNLAPDQKLPRPIINKIMHFTNQNLSFAMQSKPAADVLPANDDPLALGDANVANAFVQWLQEPNVEDFERTLWDATLWANVANEAYIKWTYSQSLGRPSIKFVPSVDLISDPYARDFYRSRWVCHTQFLDIEQVYDTYGKEVAPQAIEKADVEKARVLREMGSAPVMEGATVQELWMLPCRRYPKGFLRVWTGREVLLELDEYPYDHGELPFTQIGVIPRPNSKHYASPVTFLRSPQAELNKYHTQRLLTREAWALLKLWLPEEIELQTPWDNSPNQVLRGSSSTGAAPQIIGPTGAMPDNNDGDWLAQEMQNVVGLHEVSQGQVPGRVEAAKAIELLRESDTSRLAVLIATTGSTISKGWYQALMLARQYMKEEVLVEAYSKEGVPEVHRFFTEQFKPGMRIRVTAGSGLAFGRSARLDQLTTLWTAGVLRDPEAFAQLADIPVPQIISTKAYDVRLARNENQTLSQAKAVTANSWDDHTIHLREHNNYRKTADFTTLNPVSKNKFEMHCQEHKRLEMSALKEDAQKAMMLQQSLGPAPTEGAGPAADPANPDNFFKAAAVGPGALSSGTPGV